MKTQIWCIILMFFSPYVLFGNDEAKTIKSKLNEATVFLQGAELLHSAETVLSSGHNEIVINNLSPSIDKNSIKIKASNGVLISSFEFSVDETPIKKINNPNIRIMKDSIESLTEVLDKLRAEMKIDNELIQIMKKGVDRNIADTLSVNDLMKVMEYYQGKSSEISKRQISNNYKLKKLESLYKSINNRLEKESAIEYEKSGVLRLNCTSPISGNCILRISYFTSSAQWIPYYDINIESVDKPIKIIAKAKVRQTTTIDWTKIKLTLSTSIPSNGKTAPLFNAWFLQYTNNIAMSNRAASQNVYSYAKKEFEKSVNIDMLETKDNGISSITLASDEMAPIYFVEGVEVDTDYYSSLNPSMINEVRNIDGRQAVSIYGSRAKGGVVEVSLKKDMQDFITVDDKYLNISYNIDLPYTIPGNGKEQSIEIETKSTTANYKFYCAPKLDSETFLLAEIKNWQNLNLLSGKANITYAGAYIGETIINPSSTQDILSLTLGTEKRISVKRELVKDFNSKKSSDSSNKKLFTYRLTVKNNLNKTIEMIVKDQYPISTNKEIEADLLIKETTPPTHNVENVGVLTWEDEFKSGETKIYQMSYSVKYPAGKQVNL